MVTGPAQTALAESLTLATGVDNLESLATASGLRAEIAWQLGDSELALCLPRHFPHRFEIVLKVLKYP